MSIVKKLLLDRRPLSFSTKLYILSERLNDIIFIAIITIVLTTLLNVYIHIKVINGNGEL